MLCVFLQGGTPNEVMHADGNQNLGKKEGMEQADTELLLVSGLESSSISSADPPTTRAVSL